MTTLVWLQFASAFSIGCFIGHKITKMYYKYKLKKATKK